MWMPPFGSDSRIPPAPATTDSSAGSSATMVRTTPALHASAKFEQATAPNASRALARAAVRLQTVTRWPARSRLFAIPAPICPKPMTATSIEKLQFMWDLAQRRRRRAQGTSPKKTKAARRTWNRSSLRERDVQTIFRWFPRRSAVLLGLGLPHDRILQSPALALDAIHQASRPDELSRQQPETQQDHEPPRPRRNQHDDANQQ